MPLSRRGSRELKREQEGEVEAWSPLSTFILVGGTSGEILKCLVTQWSRKRLQHCTNQSSLEPSKGMHGGVRSGDSRKQNPGRDPRGTESMKPCGVSCVRQAFTAREPKLRVPSRTRLLEESRAWGSALHWLWYSELRGEEHLGEIKRGSTWLAEFVYSLRHLCPVFLWRLGWFMIVVFFLKKTFSV